MNWKKIQDEIYFEDGSWRDIYVLETNRNHWQKWIKLINENYLVEFFNGQTQKLENKINEEIVFNFWDGKTELFNGATIKLNSVDIKCHFFTESEIENDLDPAQIDSIENHKDLLEYLIAVSSSVQKEVILTSENCPENKLIIVENKEIRFPEY